MRGRERKRKRKKEREKGGKKKEGQQFCDRRNTIAGIQGHPIHEG
jgi:hypothetical protein